MPIPPNRCLIAFGVAGYTATLTGLYRNGQTIAYPAFPAAGSPQRFSGAVFQAVKPSAADADIYWFTIPDGPYVPFEVAPAVAGSLATPAGWTVQDDGSGDLTFTGPATQTYNMQSNGGFSASGLSATPVGFQCLEYATGANLATAGILKVGSDGAYVLIINGALGFGATQALGLYDPVSGTLLLAGSTTLRIPVKVGYYNGQSTAGSGLVANYAETKQKSETGADVNVLTFTPVAFTGIYRVNVTIDCSIWAANMSCTLTYKDSNGSAVSRALYFTDLTTEANLTVIAATGNYGVAFPFDIDNSATNIVIAVTGAVGNTYKISAVIEQLG